MEKIIRRRKSGRRETSGPEAGRVTNAYRIMEFWREVRHWVYIHLRRLVHWLHETAAGNPTVWPASFLAVSAALGLALTITTLYTGSYAVTVDGQVIGVVDSQAMVTGAIAQVERQGTRLLGHDYKIDSDVDCKFVLTLKSELDDRKTIEDYFYRQMDELSAELRKYQISVNGTAAGALESRDEAERILEEVKEQYRTENTILTEFVDDVRIENVYTEDAPATYAQLWEALNANTTGETTYTVVKGDTLSGIAYENDMSLSDLLALNPGWDTSSLMIGDVLNVKQVVPLLSVRTVEHVTYTQSIQCPVETVEDDSMYTGNSKIITQGVEGEEEIDARVTCLNGQETQREVLETTVLREPTATVQAVGTKERPITASTGSFSWPVRGTITSYFGGRYIFGGYSYHSGLDIACSYGTAISAADGGTVTFAGSRGSYGNLVIITHDNGTQTYYGHNSSLLVSAGEKVYQGQAIARAGATGNATGVHCHFEIRVGGTAVNPLSYLP